MSEQKKTRFRSPLRVLAVAAAAAAVLAVSVSAANFDEMVEGVLVTLHTSFFVTDGAGDVEYSTFDMPTVDVVERDGRVILILCGEETDVTDALTQEGVYQTSYDQGDGRCEVTVTGSPEDWSYTIAVYQDGEEESLYTVSSKDDSLVGVYIVTDELEGEVDVTILGTAEYTETE